MASAARRMRHKSSRVRNRKLGPKASNSPRQVQIAKVNFERWGMLVTRPKGHKGAGWFSAFPPVWETLDSKLRQGGRIGGIPMDVQKALIKNG